MEIPRDLTTWTYDTKFVSVLVIRQWAKPIEYAA